LALGALALPAAADTTTTTFTLSGGALSISVPASKNLGSAATGASSLSSQLGTVTVTDDRGALAGCWTATVASTDFTTGGSWPPSALMIIAWSQAQAPDHALLAVRQAE
jgi:hypothetical protein